MKIGVVTFWDSQENYGQLLQAYALQVFLKGQGHDAFVIRYDKSTAVKKKKPSLAKKIVSINWAKLLDAKALKGKINSLSSEMSSSEEPDRNFDTFRSEKLKMSERIYHSFDELKSDPPEADAYICGSDQVWNYSFIGDHRPFFLQFGKPEVKRLAYAASFGHKVLPPEVENSYQSYLSDFDAIGVRESTGVDLCSKMGFESKLLPDPTVLLDKKRWQKLSKSNTEFTRDKKNIFIYTLGNRPSDAKDVLFDYYAKQPDVNIVHSSIHKDRTGSAFPTIEEWIGYFDSCDLVLTNSFHGMVFSILFNKNFIGLPCVGSNEGMNERLTTIMSAFGLEDHLLYEFDEARVQELAARNVNWTKINAKMELWRQNANEFLQLIHTTKKEVKIAV